MVKREVLNLTDKPLTVKQGSGGNYRIIANVNSKERCTVEVDSNATYVEYLFTKEMKEKLLLNSDNFIDHEEIKIVDKDGKLEWEPTKKRESGSEVKGEFFRIMKFIKKVFGIKERAGEATVEVATSMGIQQKMTGAQACDEGNNSVSNDEATNEGTENNGI